MILFMLFAGMAAAAYLGWVARDLYDAVMEDRRRVEEAWSEPQYLGP